MVEISIFLTLQISKIFLKPWMQQEVHIWSMKSGTNMPCMKLILNTLFLEGERNQSSSKMRN